jgi:Ca2+-binding RTX toxin-like protein
MVARRFLIALAAGALAALSPAAIAEAAPGDIYVADSANNTIYRIDSGGHRFTVASGDPIAGPRGIAFGPDGQLYVATITGTGSIVRVNPSTGAKAVVASGAPLSNPRGIDFTPAGQMLVGDNGPIDDCTGGPTDSVVVRVNPATGAKSVFASGGFMNDANGVGAFASGAIFVSDCGAAGSGGPADGRVISLNPSSGVQTPVVTGGLLFNPVGLAPRLNGDAYVTDFGPTSSGGTPLDGRVVRVTATGGASLLTSGINLDNPQSPAFDFGGALVVTDIGNNASTVTTDGKVIRISLAGSQTTVEPGLRNPRGIAVEPPRCARKVATIVGTTGADVIRGSPSRDVIAGLGGRDKIKGLGARDFICGGGGKDKLVGKGGKDVLIGQGGKDKLAGGGGRDRLKGGKGRDTLRGGPGRDRLAGGRGRDRLIGGPGRDRLNGGPGRDLEIQ